jgi:hypothetical protein
VDRGVQVWAVSLLLTLVGMVLTVGVWWAAVVLGAPALTALAIGFGVALLVGAVIGGVMWWLAG